MPEWTRRDLLRAASIGGLAGGSLVAGRLLTGCGAGNTRSAAPLRPSEASPELRDRLEALAGELRARYQRVVATATGANATAVTVNASRRRAARSHTERLTVSVTNGTHETELISDDLSDAGFAAVRARLLPGDGSASSTAPTAAAPRVRDVEIVGAPDPATRPAAEWIQQCVALYERARRTGDSRIVYREAELTIDDTETLIATGEASFRQRIVRWRAGVLVAAWTGEFVSTDRVDAAGTGAIDLSRLSSDVLEASGAAALSLLSARRSVAGSVDVVLAPGPTALLVREVVAGALTGDRWRRVPNLADRLRAAPIGSSLVTVLDDPTAEGAYGRCAFDDDGQPSARSTLIEAGHTVGPLTGHATASVRAGQITGHARRTAHGLASHPANVVWQPGEASDDDLIADVKDGLLVEAASLATVDADTLRVALMADRAAEIRNGRLTGRLYRSAVASGDLGQILGSVRACSREVIELSAAATDSAPASSMSAPAILLHAQVSEG